MKIIFYCSSQEINFKFLCISKLKIKLPIFLPIPVQPKVIAGSSQTLAGKTSDGETCSILATASNAQLYRIFPDRVPHSDATAAIVGTDFIDICSEAWRTPPFRGFSVSEISLQGNSVLLEKY